MCLYVFFYWYTLFEDRDDKKSRFSIAEFKPDIIKIAAYSDHYRSKHTCFCVTTDLIVTFYYILRQAGHNRDRL